MGNRKRIKIDIEAQAKSLSEESKVAYFIAEKKFGSLNDDNFEKYKDYIENFDISKEPYKSDCEKFITDKSKIHNNKEKPVPYSVYTVSKYYNNYYKNDEFSLFKNRKVSRLTNEERVRRNFMMLGLAFYSEDEVFYDMIDEFYQKYGFELDGDFIVNDMLGKERYSKTYKEYFIKAYKESTNKDTIDVMFKDYEEIIKRARTYEDIHTRSKYDLGSMDKKEVKELLDSLVTYEYDLTRKNKEEILKTCVNSSNKVEVGKVVQFVESKVNRKNNYNDLFDATAALMELQELHAERGFFFKLFKRKEYQDEGLRIDELKTSMIEQSKELTNNTHVRDYLTMGSRSGSIYSPRLQEERMSISVFVERDIKDNFNEVVDEYEVIENEPLGRVSERPEMEDDSMNVSSEEEVDAMELNKD